MRSLILLSLLVASQASAATVYRTVDENGNVQYSDRPDGGETQQLTIRTPRASSTAPTRTAAASQPQPAGEAEQTGSAQEPSKEQLAEQAARKAKRRAENCEIARGRLERYAISHRLYRTTPDGEREYLSDAEIDEARAKAESDIKEWCN